MPEQQIFFDPERKRWKRLRRILDATAVLSPLVVIGFIFNVIRNQQLPELLLPNPKHNYRALPEPSILERNGKDMLALVPMDDLALLEKLEDEADVKAARAALAEIERTGEKPIPWEQVKAKLAAKRLREKMG